MRNELPDRLCCVSSCAELDEPCLNTSGGVVLRQEDILASSCVGVAGETSVGSPCQKEISIEIQRRAGAGVRGARTDLMRPLDASSCAVDFPEYDIKIAQVGVAIESSARSSKKINVVGRIGDNIIKPILVSGPQRLRHQPHLRSATVQLDEECVTIASLECVCRDGGTDISAHNDVTR